MKYLIISYLLVAFVTNCNNGNQQQTNAVVDSTSNNNNIVNDSLRNAVKNETIAGKWFLQPVLPSDTASGRIPFLDFDLKENRFNGNTGCNGMGGSFTLNGDALSFGENIISTKMACPGYNEKSFFDNLLKTNRFEIKNGTLQLMYNTTVLSNWVRKVDITATKQI